MSDSPQTPQSPNQRLNKEYEDPHYHDEDEAAPVDDEEHRRSNAGKSSSRRKSLYRPRRRFIDD
ncbi:MAG TPA: hypothetical protein VH592_05725 [Gemmataceae bacterium]